MDSTATTIPGRSLGVRQDTQPGFDPTHSPECSVTGRHNHTDGTMNRPVPDKHTGGTTTHPVDATRATSKHPCGAAGSLPTKKTKQTNTYQFRRKQLKTLFARHALVALGVVLFAEQALACADPPKEFMVSGCEEPNANGLYKIQAKGTLPFAKGPEWLAEQIEAGQWYRKDNQFSFSPGDKVSVEGWREGVVKEQTENGYKIQFDQGYPDEICNGDSLILRHGYTQHYIHFEYNPCLNQSPRWVLRRLKDNHDIYVCDADINSSEPPTTGWRKHKGRYTQPAALSLSYNTQSCYYSSTGASTRNKSSTIERLQRHSDAPVQVIPGGYKRGEEVFSLEKLDGYVCIGMRGVVDCCGSRPGTILVRFGEYVCLSVDLHQISHTKVFSLQEVESLNLRTGMTGSVLGPSCTEGLVAVRFDDDNVSDVNNILIMHPKALPPTKVFSLIAIDGTSSLRPGMSGEVVGPANLKAGGRDGQVEVNFGSGGRWYVNPRTEISVEEPLLAEAPELSEEQSESDSSENEVIPGGYRAGDVVFSLKMIDREVPTGMRGVVECSGADPGTVLVCFSYLLSFTVKLHDIIGVGDKIEVDLIGGMSTAIFQGKDRDTHDAKVEYNDTKGQIITVEFAFVQRAR